MQSRQAPVTGGTDDGIAEFDGIAELGEIYRWSAIAPPASPYMTRVPSSWIMALVGSSCTVMSGTGKLKSRYFRSAVWR